MNCAEVVNGAVPVPAIELGKEVGGEVRKVRDGSLVVVCSCMGWSLEEGIEDSCLGTVVGDEDVLRSVLSCEIKAAFRACVAVKAMLSFCDSCKVRRRARIDSGVGEVDGTGRVRFCVLL